MVIEDDLYELIIAFLDDVSGNFYPQEVLEDLAIKIKKELKDRHDSQ